MPAGATDWFSAVEKRLEIARKEFVPKEKWAAVASDDDEVAAVLNLESAGNVPLSVFRLNISRSDIAALNDGKWLNDEVIKL